MASIKITKDNFDEKIKQSNLPVLIDFWASWCGPCQMMGPVFEELSDDYADKLVFAKLSTEEEPDLAGQYNITGIPCLILAKEGKEVDRIVGFLPKDGLKQKIDEAMKKL